MPLVTIADLDREPPGEVTDRMSDAAKLGALYDEFLNTQSGDAPVRSARGLGERPAGIHASELACLRKVAYSVTSYPKRDIASKWWKQKFKVGRALHRMLEDDFHEMAEWTHVMRSARAFGTGKRFYLDFQSEVLLSPELQPVAADLGIYGRCDGIFTLRAHPHGPAILRVLVEIKTESPDEYGKLKRPKPEHEEQVHTYMRVLDIPITWFVYFSKGTENISPSHPPFLTTFDSGVWRRVADKCRAVYDHAARRALPERSESMQCQFCPYAWHCEPKFLGRNPAPAPLVRALGTPSRPYRT